MRGQQVDVCGVYSASRIAHGTEADPLPDARVSAAAELGRTLPLPESPSHLEDAPMDARLDSSDPPAHRRLTPGTRTGAPRRPEPQRPASDTGHPLSAARPIVCGQAAGPHRSPPLPPTTPPLPQCAHSDSALWRCGHGWQAHQERVSGARGGGNGMRGRRSRCCRPPSQPHPEDLAR